MRVDPAESAALARRWGAAADEFDAAADAVVVDHPAAGQFGDRAFGDRAFDDPAFGDRAFCDRAQSALRSHAAAARHAAAELRRYSAALAAADRLS